MAQNKVARYFMAHGVKFQTIAATTFGASKLTIFGVSLMTSFPRSLLRSLGLSVSKT